MATVLLIHEYNIMTYLASCLDSLGFHDFHLPYSYAVEGLLVVVVVDLLAVASFVVQDALQFWKFKRTRCYYR